MRRALDLSLKYKGEFMDDHAPLLGDPGAAVAGTGEKRGVAGQQGVKK
jgi:hypothetical protein